MYQLTQELVFPPIDRALPEGLLAVGGDLSRERLLLAYSLGIFPWYGEGDPILWWSPDPRMVLLPEEFHVPRRLRRTLRSSGCTLTLDTAFERVIAACADITRPGQDGTWITREMEAAYAELHRAGYAHSAECWEDGQLVGGVYGISLGRCFFGESMFARRTDASKLAFWALVEHLRRGNVELIDCQVHTEHLAGLGARDISRREFRERLERALEHENRVGRWTLEAKVSEAME